MKKIRSSRNHLFDLLRILFATLVLLSHSFELTDCDRSRELFGRLTHSGMSFGELGVDGFFLLSGFLIVQSWQHNPEFLNFLRKRILRIVPGYLVAALLSTLVVGLIASGTPNFFQHLGMRYLRSILLLSYPITPWVFPGTCIHLVNGALWTISYEFRCYLLVAFFGICGLLRRPALWLGLTLIFIFAMIDFGLQQRIVWSVHEFIFGRLVMDIRLTATFLVGGCFWLFRDRIRFNPWIACVAASVLVAVDRFAPSRIEPAIVLCGSYLLFYLGERARHRFNWMQRVPDISYGVYLYGWPVMGLGLWFLHWSPWPLFLLSTLISFGLGWLSWHVVERPMLTLKRRPTAPLPPP